MLPIQPGPLAHWAAAFSNRLAWTQQVQQILIDYRPRVGCDVLPGFTHLVADGSLASKSSWAAVALFGGLPSRALLGWTVRRPWD